MKASEVSKLEILSDKLKSVAKDFPHQQRMMWAVKNEMHLETVNRYLRGAASSIPIAEMLLKDINSYLKNNPIAA